MKNNWVLFVASRYIFKGRGNSPVLSILGIATGVLALIVIMAVMNGFQLGFIESIIEVSSYHLRVESVPREKIGQAQELLLSVPGIRAAVPFREFQALARGRRSGQQAQQAVLVRGLPENVLELDHGFAGRLNFTRGSFDISENNSVLLGSGLAARLGLGVRDQVTMFSLSGIFAAEDDGGYDTFVITGIFTTGFSDYDHSWAFVNIENDSFFMDESDIVIGVKIANRFHDRQALEQARNVLTAAGGFEEARLSSWREYNRSFFGALRTEKLFMFILVGLIFIVVGLNIFQAQRRAVMQRREEIGLMRAVGGSEKAVRVVFLLDGAIIGLSGASIGLVLGIITASNIQNFFTLIENIVNAVINFINFTARLFGAGQADNFAIFSPATFYIGDEIPSRILTQDVVLVFLFGFLSALVAAWFASRKAVQIQPAEVLRYE